jgi:hypothetical protein
MIDEREKIYVPLSERTLRKLDQVVIHTGFEEDRVINMMLDNWLACIRQFENDNFPGALPPVADVLACARDGEPAGL